jgi:hypothetical protein
MPPDGVELASQLLLVPALDARFLQQLAVLLLRHPLAALLDDRAHQATTLLGTTADGHAITLTRYGRLGHTPETRDCTDANRPCSPLAYRSRTALASGPCVTAWQAAR